MKIAFQPMFYLKILELAPKCLEIIISPLFSEKITKQLLIFLNHLILTPNLLKYPETTFELPSHNPPLTPDPTWIPHLVILLLSSIKRLGHFYLGDFFPIFKEEEVGWLLDIFVEDRWVTHTRFREMSSYCVDDFFLLFGNEEDFADTTIVGGFEIGSLLHDDLVDYEHVDPFWVAF